MKREGGFTLIEAMITVAILGIVTVALLQAGTSARLRATERLQQERATQVLEFEAEALSTGASPNPEMELTLLAELPEARIERARSGRTATVRVTWGHGRTTTRELTVFTKGAK
jgi:prepilin-type N-terminal cleavage/methylation domain-containing protein